MVDIEPLPAVVDPERAFDAGAAVLFPEHGSNLALSNVDPWDEGFFDEADVVVRGRFENQRMAVVPMEPNSFAALPDQPEPGRLTVYASTQMPHLIQPMLAPLLGLEPSAIRVIAPHVGGGFGGKAGLSPEYTVVAAAALRLGRPVTWTESRSEDMVALPHSRAQVQYVELGCRRDGTFTGLRARLVGDAGAYPGIGAMLPTGTRRMSMGTYALGKVAVDIACVATNTTPTGAFRGAGRPEAASMVERIVDQAALELDIDPVELRRRNFIAPDRFPFDTLTGVTYDSGDYDLPLRRVLELSDYDELRRQQAARRADGRGPLLGIGLCTYVEITAGGGSADYAAVAVHPDGSATVTAGTSAHGQGHRTSFAMIVADRLGIPVERVQLVQSDTDQVRSGAVPAAPARCRSAGRPCGTPPRPCWSRPARWPPACWRPPPTTSSSTRAAVSGWPASPHGRSAGPSWPPLRPKPPTPSTTPTAPRAWPPSSTGTRVGPRSPSAPTWPSSRSTPTRAG